ncbi:MAG: exonuclease SbcCD subunit D [Alistipes sp.]|nr:exonuclease SbcCD subunit D [Alistipes sp.]
MKIMHISDLHLGKRMAEYSLYAEQRDMLEKLLSAADSEKPDILVIAGDVYNKAVPPENSVELFDDFISEVSDRKIPVFIISGNHDSAERIAFGGRIMKNSGVYVSPVYKGDVQPIVLADEEGDVNIYMLPFIKPFTVREFFPDRKIESYNDAVKAAVEQMNIDTSKRNILITHQFITGASLSDSEEIFIGGTENVDGGIFAGFDYVALGHIHSPQNIGKKMRYCGSPLKYSFSEAGQTKSITIAELGKKGELEIRTLPIKPLRDVKSYTGSFEELTGEEFCGKINTDDHVYLILTDEQNIPDCIHKLRKVYSHIAGFRYENSRTKNITSMMPGSAERINSPEELFDAFYREYSPNGMNGKQIEYLKWIIRDIWGGETE